MNFISNARMYSVTPEAETAWQDLLAHVAGEAGVPLGYIPYPAPKPLETLWARPDLGCVLMCGYPIALKLSDVAPIAAPVPSLAWAQNRAAYRSDFIVRRNSGFETLEDTFGGSFGWTVAHSHSGFNAPRHHLLQYRSPGRPRLYSRVRRNLVTARAVLDAVLAGEIDTGPLDGYWHALIAKHRPELTRDIRIVASTALAPIPSFVASPVLGATAISRLQDTLAQAAQRPWFPAIAEVLLLSGFAPVAEANFAPTLAWDRAAVASGYAEPA